MNFTGHSGNDNFNGTNAHDVFDLSQGGEDTANGRGGDDEFDMGAALDAGDQIDGGAGNDTVVLDGEYTTAFPFKLTFTATTMVNVETLVFSAGHNYNLISHDATVAVGKTMTIDASALNASHVLKFDGSAETDGRFEMTGGAGNDQLTGGNGDDTFDLTLGGNDTVNAGAGHNTVLMGAALNHRDTIIGAGGDTTVVLDGDYSSGVVFGADTFIQVGHLLLTAGHDYDLTTDGSIADVDASALGAANSLHYDSSSQAFDDATIRGGHGDDVVRGGGGDSIIIPGTGRDVVHAGDGADTVQMGANLTAVDRIDGGAGIGDVLALNGDYTGANAVTLQANTIVNFESITFGAGHSYDLTFDPDNFDDHSQCILDASALKKTDALNITIDPNAFVKVIAGEGDDTVIGSPPGQDALITPVPPIVDLSEGGNDTVVNCTSVAMGGTLTAADSITNGVVSLDGNYFGAHKLVLGAATFHDVDEVDLFGGHSYDITTNDANLSAGHHMTVAFGSAPGDRLIFDGSAETDGSFSLNDTAGNDVIAGGAQGDTFIVFAGGDDTVHGNGGNDEFNVSAAALAGNYLFDGGAGSDTMTFQPGDVSTTFTANLKNMEAITVGFTYHFDFITVDANVGAGKTMTVDGSGLTGGGTLGFNGSAETNGNFTVIGGLNNEALTTGAGNDTLQGGLGGDSLTGGAGNDIFRYTSVAESTSSTHDADMDFDPAHDKFDLNVHVKGIDPAINGQLFISQSFDSQLETQVSGLVPHHAVLFTAGAGGDISGTFLIVDANGVTGYQASEDYVIQVALSTLSKSLFI